MILKKFSPLKNKFVFPNKLIVPLPFKIYAKSQNLLKNIVYNGENSIPQIFIIKEILGKIVEKKTEGFLVRA